MGYEGGFIGNQPQWTPNQRSGIWTPQSIIHRQKQNLWATSFDSNLLNFSPLIWLDASDSSTISTDSGKVFEWRDKSGNGYKANETDIVRYPRYNLKQQNNLPLITFDTNTGLSLDINSLPAPFSIVLVSSTFLSGLTRILQGGAGANYIISPTRINTNFRVLNPIGSVPISTINTFTIITVITNNNPINNQIWFQGNDYATLKTIIQNWNSKIVIGRSSLAGQNEHANSDIAEIMIFNYALPTATRQAIENELSFKWNIPV